MDTKEVVEQRDRTAREVVKLTAQRDRYEAALKRLSDKWPAEGETAWEYAGSAVDIAQAALKED